MDIIIDIETLGTRPGCEIIEIGAVAVGPNGKIGDEFDTSVSTRTTLSYVERVAAGAVPCTDGDRAETCRWWTGDAERRETLAAIMDEGVFCLRETLEFFGAWLGNPSDDIRIWANGPSFDIAILEHAYRECGIPRPWKCTQERCVRTALDLGGYVRGSIQWEEDGPRHRALLDARHEARKLLSVGAIGAGGFIARREREQIIAGLVSRGTISGAEADRMLGKGA